MEFKIRKIEKKEYPLLTDFLYEAIYVHEGEEPPERSIIEQPELQVYVSGFGNSVHDRAVVAEIQGKVVGAAWTRIMDDYGHVDEDTPSLAISLYKEYRGKGMGTLLLKELLLELKNAGYERVSLSVQKENYAAEMYKKHGFFVYQEKEDEYIMLLNLKEW